MLALRTPMLCLTFGLLGTATASFLPERYTPWLGRWMCNLDGRNSTLEFFALDEPNVSCSGDICTSTSGNVTLAGVAIDASGSRKSLALRPLNAKDPKANNGTQILALSYNRTDDWLLLLHTWDKRYASGFTTWNGNIYGLQCKKQP